MSTRKDSLHMPQGKPNKDWSVRWAERKIGRPLEKHIYHGSQGRNMTFYSMTHDELRSLISPSPLSWKRILCLLVAGFVSAKFIHFLLGALV